MTDQALTPEQQKAMEKVSVRLTKPHTHAGVKLAAGTLIDVERHYAEAIVAMKAGTITESKRPGE